MKNIVIIGNGISGITCARFVRKNSRHSITVISSETDHFFSRTALMYIYMGHMTYENTKPYEDWFWKKNRIDLIKAKATEIDFSIKQLKLDNGQNLAFDVLVLALGSKPNMYSWPGQDLKGVQGLYSYQDLQTMEAYSKDLKNAVIVGGGLIGIEMAEMFLSRGVSVDFLVREKSFWNNILPSGESEMINRHIREHHIHLHLQTELEEIISDSEGRCKAIKTKNGENIECQFVGLTAGVSPNINFVKNSPLECDRGILVDEFLQTNLEDVYAIGDCAQFRIPPKGRSAIEQVWYTGRMHGEIAALNICDIKTPYVPGPWFNSAKFLDIEYQTYGNVSATYGENETGFYWEHKNGKKAIHLVFDKNTFEIIGINLMGIRHRHEVWDKWLREKRSVQYILSYLHEADFDPEFFDNHNKELINAFNLKFPEMEVQLDSTLRSIL